MDDDDRAEWTPQRAPRGAWIAGSVLAFLVGWLVIIWAIATTAAPTVEERADVHDLAAAFTVACSIAVLVPAAAIVSLSIGARRGRTGAAAGVAVCFGLLAIALLTMVPLALLSIGEARADTARRAQPPTALETSRTPERAEAELVGLGARVVGALGADAPSDDQVSVDVRPCVLDNFADGVLVHYIWRGAAADEWDDTPVGQDGPATPAVRFLEGEGFEVTRAFPGGGAALLDRDQHISADVYSAGRIVLRSPCVVDTDG
ncbi:hypothetical protein DEJ23_10215 [Curtobacterium sp. MCSS17_008]|uniref:hypothetical protein n=1 Tax=Curtobacterium sp. MCSS17_008 TaxID=2175647 RepID=UPI000DA8C3A7|nr:hypothetical protein [Curtobacterium sp. MCSS17_008]PZF56532.1 hypothetical protein DEJ23_10215 [Curtobacterium sp. MCSS17_008]